MKHSLLFVMVMLVTAYCKGITLAGFNGLAAMPDSAQTVADTVARKAISTVAAALPVNTINNKLQAANPTAAAKQLKAQASGKLDEVSSSITKKLKQTTKPAVSVDLTLKNETSYNPVTSSLMIPGSQGFVNYSSINGVIKAFGVPLNINYTNNQQAGVAGLNNPGNSLFKFDFNPAQYRQLFSSDVQQYYDLQKNAFAGLSLSSYTSKVVLDKLKSEGTGLATKATNNDALTKYLSNPAQVTGLLGMNEEQIKQKLKSITQTDVKSKLSTSNPVLSKIDVNNPTGSISAAGQSTLTSKITSDLPELKSINTNTSVKDIATTLTKTAEGKVKTAVTGSIAGSDQISAYLKNPSSVKELQTMNEAQIAQKLSSLAPAKANVQDVADIDKFLPLYSSNIGGYIKKEMIAKSNADQQHINVLAHQVYLSTHSGNLASLTSQITSGNATTVDKGTLLKTASSDKTIDSIAHTITGIKAALQKQGVDVNKMVEIQRYMDMGKGTMPPSELTASFLNRKPEGTLQSLFTQIQALKIGSYGNQIPGGIQSPDRFVDGGAHITLKTGGIPITAGYGSINDVSGQNNVAYQSSVYNSPENITYLGASLNKGSFGGVKIAVVGSFSGSSSNSNYTSPTGSSNSVSLTLSKDMKMGKLGEVEFDVSKSTTLYQDKYSIGSDEPILNNKLTAANNNDLFEAIGFGITHQLDIKPANLSDNIYFSYSGMGYQNPANNGQGGGRVKLGERIQKSFHKNKLVLNLRSSIVNTPISYTSNDKFKNYNIQLDGKYNVNKKFSIDLKYTNNGTDQIIGGQRTNIYSLQGLQADGNVSYKIGKDYSVSHFSIGMQSYSNPSPLTPGNGGLMMFNYNQSVLIRKSSLTASIFYNKELQTSTLIGNMLNTSLSYQYVVLNKINLSSGITYLDNAGITMQAGIKQGIQLFGSPRFSVDSYIDLRKNMITAQNPTMYPTCMADLSLKYHL